VCFINYFYVNYGTYVLPQGLSIRDRLDKLKRYLISYFGPDHGKSIVLSERNTDAAPTPPKIHDGEMNAAYIVRQTIECSREFFYDPKNGCIFSFWCHSDVYDELGDVESEFSGLFGLITPNGIKKPNFNAFRMLHELGVSRMKVTGGCYENQKHFKCIIVHDIPGDRFFGLRGTDGTKCGFDAYMAAIGRIVKAKKIRGVFPWSVTDGISIPHTAYNYHETQTG